MEKLQTCLNLVNGLVVSGVDNCTKIAFIGKILQELMEEERSEATDGKCE